MNTINLRRFPETEISIGLLAFNHYKEFPKIHKFGDVAERIYGCYRLQHYHFDERDEFFLLNRCVHFRAALNEFVSVSEMLKICGKRELQDLSIDKTDIPLLHFFKLLREVNFHLTSLAQHSIEHKVATYNTESGEISDNKFTIQQAVISNLGYSIFKNSKNLKYYEPEIIEKIVDWVKVNQNSWGIFYILDLALRQYCIEIEKYCS